jgi:hypothetical protein
MLTGVPTPTSTQPQPPSSSRGDAWMDGWVDGWIIIIMNQWFFFSKNFCSLLNPKNWENFVSVV